jgi:N utilization substance protein B
MLEPTNRRRNGREWALQMIVQADLNPFVNADMILKHFWEQQWSCQQEAAGLEEGDMDEVARLLQPPERLATAAVQEFTEALVLGVLREREKLDELIAPYCENWSLERTGVIERCVLRLAFYELDYTDTPAPVVINEAVDLAKYFSNPESGAFVNGILDRHARRKAK